MSPRCQIETSTKPGRPCAKGTLTLPFPHTNPTHADGWQQTLRSLLGAYRRPKSPLLLVGAHDCEQDNLPTRRLPSLSFKSPPTDTKTKTQLAPDNASDDVALRTNDRAPAKRPRTNLQSVSNRSFPLTKHNLQKHNTLVMGSESDSARGSKRPASRSRTESVQSASMPTEQTASVRSQKLSGTSANYRHTILSKAGIHGHHMPTPEEICAQIDAIIHHEVTPERKEMLSCIAQQLSDRFVQVITQASGEDDCIEPFYHALSSMDHSESVAFQRKAGIVSLFNPCIFLCSLYL